VGGEDSLANMQDNRPVGIIRTFAYLGSNFTVDGWVDALKQGRTFMSSGPVVEFHVNGKMPGESVRLTSPASVHLKGKVWSSTPIRLMRIYHNGAVWRDLPPQASFSETASVTGSGWFSLVVEADELSSAFASVYAQAVTNAVRVYVGDQKIRSRPSAEYFLQWLEKLRAQISDLSLWRSESERDRAYRDLDQAAQVYRTRAREAQQ
jgi:hypothetical protein